MSIILRRRRDYIGGVKAPSGHDYSHDYLTIISRANNNNIKWKENVSGAIRKTISVSTDDGLTWTNKIQSGGTVDLATLNNGDKILIKGTNNAYGDSSGNYDYFYSDYDIDVKGNVMSLIYGDNFIGQLTLPAERAFKGLFKNSRIVDASELIIPATTLMSNCYDEMFSDCSKLTSAPALPATSLSSFCYYRMFYNCTSLTIAPTLPTSTLVYGCYMGMFKDSNNLSYIKCLATSISAGNCLYDWVYGVAANGTFVKAASMNDWPTGTNGIPYGWTVEDA